MLINRTIDDTFGDTLTGSVPTYDSSWVSSSECALREGRIKSNATQDNLLACGLLFNRSTTSNRTWHSSVGEGSMSIQFNGSAIYTYFIFPRQLLAVPDSVPSKVGANVSFILDGNIVPNYLQINTNDVVQYHVSAQNSASLSAGVHNLTIRNEGTLMENGSLLRTALVFDYAEYTVNNEVDNLRDRAGVIELGIAAGFGVLCLLCIAFFFLRLRRQSRLRHPSLKINSWESPSSQLSASLDSGLAVKWTPSYQNGHIIEFCLGNDKIQKPQTQVEKMTRAIQPVELIESNQRSVQLHTTIQLRRRSVSRRGEGVSSQTPNLLGVGIKKAITLNALENRDSGMMRRRSTLSRLGIPMRGSTGLIGEGGAACRLDLPVDSEQEAISGTRRRRTVGQRTHISAINVTDHHDAQDDRALISRLQAEIRMLREEREVRLDLERFGLEYHGEELPDYDSVV